MSEAPDRRLPVYLVLDCSGSMAGEPIEAVRVGIKSLISDLRADPQAIETAYISVITFASTAQQVRPLTELLAFQEPNIDATGGTSLGAALQLLERCLDTEVRKSTPKQKGDWKPLVFLMTDGMPTDSWQAPADRIKSKRPANVIACAAGPNADANLLKQITETVVMLANLQPEALRAFFKWVSSSVKLTSQSVRQTDPNAPPALPPLPATIQIVP